MIRLPHSPARTLKASLLAAALAATLAGFGTAAHAVDGPPPGNVAWQDATSDADIDKAFTTAKAQNKPVLLYWGAVWCPPCNQLKATLFNRQDFAEQSKSFVAVHLDGDEKNAPAPDAATRARVAQVLADPALSRTYMDVLTNNGSDIVTALAPKPGAERQKLVASLDAALVRLQADATLSRGDRLGALFARVDLARLDQPKDTMHPKLPPALVKEVRDSAATTDREATNAFERQAVIPTAAQLLEEAGLWNESAALLKSSLGKSHSPYYLMSELGSNARKQGHNADALQWYQQAFDKSEGPATRLQWGTAYLGALVDLAPNDAKRIEATAQAVFNEAAGQPNAFDQRSGRSLKRLGAKLVKWNTGGKHQAVIDHLGAQVQGLCGKLPAGDEQRATCDDVFKPASAKA